MPFLYWLDAEQSRYLGLAYALIYALAALGLLSFSWPAADRRLSSRWGTAAFFGLAALALLAARWPPLFVREELNIDEAGMLALANQMVHFPLPWIDYDPQTVGPLDALVLDVPRLIGLTPGWISTRVIALGVWLVASAGLYASTALLFEARVARLALLPVTLFFATVYQRDFLHYSSELLPAALTMWATYLLLLAVRRRLRLWPVAGCGLLAGALPFAKLQATPLAAMIALLLALCIGCFASVSWRTRLSRSLLAAVAAAIVPAIVLLPVAAHGGLGDFWISYVLSGINYIWSDYMPPSFVFATQEFAPFFDASAFVALQALWLVPRMWRRLDRAQRVAPFVFAAVLGAALVAIYVPKHGSAHYLLFAVFPIASCAAYVLGLATREVLRLAGLPRRTQFAGILAVAFVVATCVAMPWTPQASPYIGWLSTEVERPLDPTAAALDYWAGAGMRVAIWGWAPNMWVNSQTLMGTRDLLCQHQLDPGPYREYFRVRYLQDFVAAKPEGFLDAVTPDSFGYYDQGKYGFETFPSLAKAVWANYDLVAVIGKGYRVYVRRDLLKRRGLTLPSPHISS